MWHCESDYGQTGRRTGEGASEVFLSLLLRSLLFPLRFILTPIPFSSTSLVPSLILTHHLLWERELGSQMEASLLYLVKISLSSRGHLDIS